MVHPHTDLAIWLQTTPFSRVTFATAGKCAMLANKHLSSIMHCYEFSPHGHLRHKCGLQSCYYNLFTVFMQLGKKIWASTDYMSSRYCSSFNRLLYISYILLLYPWVFLYNTISKLVFTFWSNFHWHRSNKRQYILCPLLPRLNEILHSCSTPLIKLNDCYSQEVKDQNLLSVLVQNCSFAIWCYYSAQFDL